MVSSCGHDGFWVTGIRNKGAMLQTDTQEGEVLTRPKVAGYYWF